jgi:hypothetical protein
MRARLPLLYSVLAFAILMGAQAAGVAAQDKRATPPSAKDLVGIWIGFDSDQLTFTRLDLRLDSTGFCARVSVPPENSEQPKGRSYSSKRTAKVDGLATLLESGEPNSL